MLKLTGAPNKFGKNGPSSKWFRNFLKRRKKLKESRPSGRNSSRALMSTQATMDNFFDLYG